MKKIIIALLVGVMAVGVASGCKASKSSSGSSEAYKAKNADNPYYEKSVEKLRSTVGLTDEQADEAFGVMVKCGIVDKEINNIFKKGSGDDIYYDIWYGLSEYSVYFADGEITKITALPDKVYYENGEVVTQATEKATEKTTEAAKKEAATPIVFTNYTNYVEAGSTASVTIQGAPNTDYTIHVYYDSGESEAEGLGMKKSDANGVVSWEWKVGIKTNPGTHAIKVVGGNAENSVQFEVV